MLIHDSSGYGGTPDPLSDLAIARPPVVARDYALLKGFPGAPEAGTLSVGLNYAGEASTFVSA